MNSQNNKLEEVKKIQEKLPYDIDFCRYICSCDEIPKCSNCKPISEAEFARILSKMRKEKDNIKKRKKSYIKKRKPMKITLADLDESMNEDDEFKADVRPTMMRSMPMRKSVKERIMDDLDYLEKDESESDDFD